MAEKADGAGLSGLGGRMTGLSRTPLYDLHVALGAKMVPFAGYEMPVQYPLGVLKEHLHTRAAAGLFDVSHMGQVILRGQGVASALEALVPVDVIGLKEGRQRYGLFTNDVGGVLDDLMIANRGDHLFVVVNAACKAADVALMKAGLPGVKVDYLEDRALLALQGPLAEAALATLAPDVTGMRFMDHRVIGEYWVSRSGYTGEDGFEISLPAGQAMDFAKALLAVPDVQPIGLGARDSLRLEAGLCLYGHDLDDTITPVEGALSWAIQKVRRTGGERAGGFPGAGVILRELESGPNGLRVGLLPEGRAPMREETLIYATETGTEAIGYVTSGGFGPTLGRPVAMGYVPPAQAVSGTRLWGDVRGKRLPVSVVDLPFVPHTYKR
jgi:aminomethyltransferase